MRQTTAFERVGAGLGGCAISIAEQDPVTVIRGLQLQKEAILHWASFTFPFDEEETGASLADWVVSHFPGDVELLDRVPMGYTNGWRLVGGALVLWRPDRPDMGVHVSIPGEALPFLGLTPLQLVVMVLAKGGKFSRIDIALDTDKVSMATIFAACAQREGAPHGDCVTMAKYAPTAGDLWNPGETLYIGKRSSMRYVRFYNKAAQQGLTDGTVWTRAEVEFKKKLAQLAAIHIANGCDLADLIASAVDFRAVGEDSNVSRCQRLPWWQQWIEGAVKLSFALPKLVEETVEKVYEWVRKVAGPSIAFLDKFWNHHPTWLYELADNNAYRVPIERRMMLAGVVSS